MSPPINRIPIHGHNCVGYPQVEIVRAVGSQIVDCEVRPANSPTDSEVAKDTPPAIQALQKTVQETARAMSWEEELTARNLTDEKKGKLLEDLIAQLDSAVLAKAGINIDDIRKNVKTPEQFIDNQMLARCLTVSHLKAAIKARTEAPANVTPAQVAEQPANVSTTSVEAAPQAPIMPEAEPRDPLIESIMELSTTLSARESATVGSTGFISGAAEALQSFANAATPEEIHQLKRIIQAWEENDSRSTKGNLNANEEIKGILSAGEALMVAFAKGRKAASESRNEPNLTDRLTANFVATGQYIRNHNEGPLQTMMNPYLLHLNAAYLQGAMYGAPLTDEQMDTFITSTVNHQSIGLRSVFDANRAVKQLVEKPVNQ